MAKVKFDGSLESVLAVVDAQLEENPRSSAKMIREALSTTKVDIPTVEGSELVTNGDGSIEVNGSTFVPEDLVSARLASVQAEADEAVRRLRSVEARAVEAEQALAEAQNELSAASAAASKEDLPGSDALRAAADILLQRPNLSTTNRRVAKWLLTL